METIPPIPPFGFAILPARMKRYVFVSFLVSTLEASLSSLQDTGSLSSKHEHVHNCWSANITLSYQRTLETHCNQLSPALVPGTAQALTDSIPWLIKSDLDVVALNVDGRKTLMTIAGVMHHITSNRGATEATMLDHDLEPMKKDCFFAFCSSEF